MRNFTAIEQQEPLSTLAAEYQSGSPILLEKIKVLFVVFLFCICSCSCHFHFKWTSVPRNAGAW